MKEILKHLKADWYKYALETLVVIIGILVAFALNNWNESRKRANQEAEILNAIGLALRSDVDQLEGHIGACSGIANALSYMIPHLQEKKAYNDTLGTVFAVLTSTAQLDWTPNLTAYSILESTGLDIIRNDSLKTSILEVYNKSYPRIDALFTNYKGNVIEYGRPLIRREFIAIKINDAYFQHRPVDYSAALDDVELMNILLNLEDNNRRNLEELKAFKEQVSLVIEAIDEELVE